MNGGSMDALIEQLIDHEGLELKPYPDTVGKVTIGVGRNLDDKGITKEEAMYLLTNDVHETITKLKTYIPNVYNNMDTVRKRVLIDMAFNMGIYGLLKFKRMLAALRKEDYIEAALQMEDSKWYRQVKRRGKKLKEMMIHGERRSQERV